MYNEVFKHKYLNFIKDNEFAHINTIRSFKRIEEYEDMMERDLCDFSVTEIINFYKMVATPSLEFLMVMNNTYLNYTGYCLANGLVSDSQNHYAEINNQILLSCVNNGKAAKKIITEDDLNAIMNMLANVSDRFFIKAIFEGIYVNGFEDIMFANIDQIDSDNIMHCYSGREVQISDELVELAKESTDEYVFHIMEDGIIKREVEFDNYDNNILKMFPSAKSAPSKGAIIQRAKIRLIRIRRESGYQYLVTKSIRESGRINMIKKLAAENPGMELKDLIIAFRAEIEDRYGVISSIERYVLKYKKYIDD